MRRLGEIAGEIIARLRSRMQTPPEVGGRMEQEPVLPPRRRPMRPPRLRGRRSETERTAPARRRGVRAGAAS